MKYIYCHCSHSKRTSALVLSIIATLALSFSIVTHADTQADSNTIGADHTAVNTSLEPTQTEWLQLAERKARPGSGAYSRSKSESETTAATSDDVKTKEVRTAKARPGSGARSRSKQTTNEAIANSGTKFASDEVKKRSRARPGSRARKAQNEVSPVYSDESKESLAQTPKR